MAAPSALLRLPAVLAGVAVRRSPGIAIQRAPHAAAAFWAGRAPARSEARVWKVSRRGGSCRASSGRALLVAAAASAVVEAGDDVEVHYVGTLDDGTQFDSSEGKEPLKFKVGAGQLIAGFDSAVLGLSVGEKKTVSLEPRQGYGEWKEDRVIRVPLTEAPGDYNVGQSVELSNGQVAKVTDVTEEHVEIDANHQLAGKTLHFDIELVSLTSAAARFPLKKSDSEWKSALSDFEFKVLREKGTEPAGTGEYDKFYPDSGYFACRGCGAPLYSAQAKFNSGCGWPAFDKCYAGSIITETDMTFGMKRVEIMCANCGGHMGHVFEGERLTDTDERHCVNSVSVKFVNGDPPAGLEEAKVV
mmetsp:Transcript_42385/g.106342  ORF Transcript_42385/g.106342 Transcript_42385/m.106342 type:complete len:358 (-) Transcript_42385:302-1375(-)